MAGWHGQTDGWMDGQTDGWKTNGQTDWQMDRQTDEKRDGRTVRWSDGQMDRQTNKQALSCPESLNLKSQVLKLNFWTLADNKIKMGHYPLPNSLKKSLKSKSKLNLKL